jgi:hypothetical protein
LRLRRVRDLLSGSLACDVESVLKISGNVHDQSPSRPIVPSPVLPARQAKDLEKFTRGRSQIQFSTTSVTDMEVLYLGPWDHADAAKEPPQADAAGINYGGHTDQHYQQDSRRNRTSQEGKVSMFNDYPEHGCRDHSHRNDAEDY